MNLLRIEALREVQTLRSNRLQFLFGNAVLGSLFFGYRYLPASGSGVQSGSDLVSFIAWVALVATMTHSPASFEGDINNGIIDRMALSQWSLRDFAFARSVTSMARAMLPVLFVVLLLRVLGQGLPRAGMAWLVVPASCALGGAMGLLLSGVSLLVRPVAFLQLPLYMGFVAGFAYCQRFLGDSAGEQARLAGIIAACAAALFIVGGLVFGWCERKAIALGTLKR